MTAKGYCKVEDVTAITGDLTAAQINRAATLIEQAETWLDGEIGRGWLVGEQSLEAHFLPADYLHLDLWPIESVAAVNGRSGLGETEETLTVDEDYEVQDLAAGVIRLVSPGSWDRIRVTYTPVDAVPGDVALACAELVANWMQPTLRPGTYGLDSYSLPDLSIKFARSHVQQSAPPFVRSVVDRYAESVHS